MLAALALVLTLFLALPARACQIALVLATDVSGSVDGREYALQANGLAFALRDPEVTAALVDQQVAVAVTQWSDAQAQALSVDWTRIASPRDVDALATRIARMPRAFSGSDTGVGAALLHAAAQFDRARDCLHHVIDISSDGQENSGFTLSGDRRAVVARGVTINALAIEDRGIGRAVTNFYRAQVISSGGFVITARDHDDFARAMREKLLRELRPPMILGAFSNPAHGASAN